MKPFLYRFQIRSYHRTDDDQGNTTREFGDILWEEPPGRESTTPIKVRVSIAMGHMDGFERLGQSVALGIKEILSDAPWTPEYCVAGR